MAMSLNEEQIERSVERKLDSIDKRVRLHSRILLALMKKAEITAFRQRDLLIECRDVLAGVVKRYTNDCQCQLSDNFTCIYHQARALLNKLES